MRIAEALRKTPVTLPCDRTITEAAQLMDTHAVGALVVTDADRPVGIVTDRDLAVRAVAHRLSPDARIDNVMTTDFVTLPVEADLRDVLALFREHAVRRVPVVEDARVVGLVSLDDLLVDLVGDLADLVRPVTGQVLFGHPEPQVPVS